MMTTNLPDLANFTYTQWHSICSILSSLSRCRETLGDIECFPNQPFYLKHDVECSPKRALDLAIIAHKYNIRATFYFQFSVFKDNIDIARQIIGYDHEIGYHYDVLDASSGDYNKALSMFLEHISFFRSHGFLIKTICPHGNPLLERNGWSSNKDFLRSSEIRKALRCYFDVVIDWPNHFAPTYSYVSDAGYSWNQVVDIAENDRSYSSDLPIESILKYISSTRNLVISTHPHRWRRSFVSQWIIYIRFSFLKSIAKFLWQFSFLKKFISPFFHLAKKF